MKVQHLHLEDRRVLWLLQHGVDALENLLTRIVVTFCIKLVQHRTVVAYRYFLYIMSASAMPSRHLVLYLEELRIADL